MLIKRAEQAVLQLQLLGDRLDEDVCTCRCCCQLGDAGEVCEGRGALLLGDLAARDALREVLGDAGQAGIDPGLVDIVEADRHAGLRADLGDAVTHGPGAEDGYVLKGHYTASTMVLTPCPTPTQRVARP